MLRGSLTRATVAMMAGQELLAESDPLIEEGPAYEGGGAAHFRLSGVLGFRRIASLGRSLGRKGVANLWCKLS
jgi:hypothetical protein